MLGSSHNRHVGNTCCRKRSRRNALNVIGNRWTLCQLHRNCRRFWKAWSDFPHLLEGLFEPTLKSTHRAFYPIVYFTRLSSVNFFFLLTWSAFSRMKNLRVHGRHDVA